MSAVIEAIGDVFEAVGDVVGDVVEGVFDVVETIMDEVVVPVMDTVSSVVEAAIDDPVGTIAKVATAIYAPYLLPLTNAAVTIANGGDLEDGLKSAALTYAAQGVGQYVNSAADMAIAENFAPGSLQAITNPVTGEVANQVIKGSVADIAGNVLGGVASNTVRGGDPLDALLAGSINVATDLLTQEIPGFEDLSKGVQSSIKDVVSSTLQGENPTQALLNTALNAGISAARGATGETGVPAAAEDQTVATEDGIASPRFDEFSGMPMDDGLASLTENASAEMDEDGIPSLIDNGDGTFSQKMSDGSEIVKDEFGNFVEVKNPTEVAFEEQAEQSERDKLLGGKTQDEMTPQDWQAIYATPTTDPVTGETVVGADPSMYNVQNLGIGDDVDLSFFDDPYAAWAKNEDGSRTYTYDDGSTVTADQDGNIINVTETTDTPYNPGPKTYTYDDGSTLTVDEDGNVIDTTEATDFPYMTGKTPSAPGGPVIKLPFGANQNVLRGAGALLGGAAVLGSLGGDDEQEQEAARMRMLGMNWNQQGVNSLVNGKAYGQQFFDPKFEEIPAAKGGLMSLAAGGPTSSRYNLGSYSDGGRLLRGPGDGMSDNIPATIARKQPARLADGEFVIPADVVSHLGNGSTDAGSRVLYKMMEKVRRARTGNAKQGKKINPNKLVPR